MTPSPGTVRTARARWRGVPELVVALLVAGGLGLVTVNHWRLGLATLGGGLVAAAVFRLLLPPGEVPFLVNRSRAVDVVVLSGLGCVVLALAYTLIYRPPFSLSG
ncbi:MAG: DUF3017 domain-containing protein [Actinomycetota bacterium]|nr:DUF3017 domain-containing protein [Actinomycetota bacterium]